MDIAEIDREIRKIEADKTSWTNCEKLSILYNVRDHQQEERQPRRMMPEYSYSAPPELPSSEFADAMNGVPLESAMKILDEHFESVKIVFPKEYDLVMRRIRSLKDNF